MSSDLKVDIDGVQLNVRAGVIIKYDSQILIEISMVGRNSVIPGGRIKINEESKKSLIRELEEELGFCGNKDKLSFITVFENFFNYNQKDYHEIYFLYEYSLSEEEYKQLAKVKGNKDNDTTYFKFINISEIKKYNLLPLEVIEYIKKEG